MQGTSNWYCAKCSHFNDNSLATCNRCGRFRGSARFGEYTDEEFSLDLLYVSPTLRTVAPPPKKQTRSDRAAVKGDGAMPFSSGRSSRNSKGW